MLQPQLNKHQIKIYNIFSREYKLIIGFIFVFVLFLFVLGIFFPEVLQMAFIFLLGGFLVTIYLWHFQASKYLTKAYILIESEGTDKEVYEWLEVWLPKEKLLEDTPTDFLWNMDINLLKKGEQIPVMDSSQDKVIPFNPFLSSTDETKVKSLDVARTLEQGASKRLFKSKADIVETIGIGLLVLCILGVGYGIIMLIESGTGAT